MTDYREYARPLIFRTLVLPSSQDLQKDYFEKTFLPALKSYVRHATIKTEPDMDYVLPALRMLQAGSLRSLKIVLYATVTPQSCFCKSLATLETLQHVEIVKTPMIVERQLSISTKAITNNLSFLTK